MREISLCGRRGEGLCCLVDDEDYEYLSKFKWFLDYNGYAYRNNGKNEFGKKCVIRMHKEVKRLARTDHKDGNRLNNQKENLRECTSQENNRNSRANRTYAGKETTSKFRGVYYERVKYTPDGSINNLKNKWIMEIKISNKPNKKISKRFGSEIEAALAYDELAKEHFGEFARLNFPNGESDWINFNHHGDGDY